MLLCDSINPPDNLEEMVNQLATDKAILEGIRNTRYLQHRTRVPKQDNLGLAWEYAQNPADYQRFINMLRVSPQVFEALLHLIENHNVFQNNSNNSQLPVEKQLAITLYRMGRFGNGASLEDVARISGSSEGTVVNYTNRCFKAIEDLHDLFVRPLTAAEKEEEKRWMDQHLGFVGTWREGWLMYDGTIVVLYAKPGLNGDAYYTRKANYGLNAQVCMSVLFYYSIF